MKRQRLVIIGFGRLGQACAHAVVQDEQVELAGVVQRTPAAQLAPPFADVPAVSHISELSQVDAALLCVPTESTIGVAHDLLQHRIPVVECATLHGEAFEAHFHEFDRIASHHKVAAIVGAGWDPGLLSLFRGLFALVTPTGHTETSWRPGVNLHHTTVARALPGVHDALSTEQRSSNERCN